MKDLIIPNAIIKKLNTLTDNQLSDYLKNLINYSKSQSLTTTDPLIISLLRETNEAIKRKKITKLHSFEESPYFNIEILKEELPQKYHKYNIEYYYESAYLYSQSKGAKYANWKSAIMTWIRKDILLGKAVMNTNKIRKINE